MGKRLFSLAAMVAAAAVLGGCSARVSVNEVLQQPLGAAIYTRYNLFYSDPLAVSCRNIQQGRMLPFGSEVEIVEAPERMVEFTDSSGLRYRINFDPGDRLYGMRDFIRESFTLTPPAEQLKEARPEMESYIRRGEVVNGMTRREVIFAYGPPAGCMTPSQKNDTWIYWNAPEHTFRVIFRNNAVVEILNPDEIR